MFGQTFAPHDLLLVAFLAISEIILSADNAIVLGLLVQSTPKNKRRLALNIGMLSSFFIRIVCLFFITLILKSIWLQILGGAYLIYLCIKHLSKRKTPKKALHSSSTSFWKTVLLIETYDLIFALDSIIVAAAFIQPINGREDAQPKLWIAACGALIGMLAIRSAAQVFSSLIERFPRMESVAHLMIGWIGLKLAIAPFYHGTLFESLFWIVFLLLFLTGFTKRKFHA